MIRRDYILRMIEEFLQALSRIRSLKKEQHFEQAAVALDEEFNRLIGAGAEATARLSETELLAKVMRGEPTQVVQTKIMMLTTLLKQAGDLSSTRGDIESSRMCYLKGLNLLLYGLVGADGEEIPAFVPKTEMFVAALSDSPLPLETAALLMQHLERTRQFDKAEDTLFEMLEAEPNDPRMLEFGISFYERLRTQPDDSLSAGNLPRSEVEAGLAELRDRKSALA
jgi:hypothetical protein